MSFTRIVAASFLSLTILAPSIAVAAETGLVSADSVQVRMEPNAKAKSPWRISHGRMVSVLDHTPDGKWVKIKGEYPKGDDIVKFEGWLETKFVRSRGRYGFSFQKKDQPSSGGSTSSGADDFGDTGSTTASTTGGDDWGSSGSSGSTGTSAGGDDWGASGGSTGSSSGGDDWGASGSTGDSTGGSSSGGDDWGASGGSTGDSTGGSSSGGDDWGSTGGDSGGDSGSTGGDDWGSGDSGGDSGGSSDDSGSGDGW